MTPTQNTHEKVSFHRTELAVILSIYGRRVAAGEWHDYAIGMRSDHARFEIFQHRAATPIYAIEKWPKLRLRQGQYLVLGLHGQVLKRGHDIKTCLRVLETSNLRAVQ